MPNSVVITEQDFYQAAKAAGIDVVNAPMIQRIFEQYRKDTMPAGGRPTYDGRMYENGPFGFIDEEITSHVISGGSPLMNWIPSRNIKDRYHHVAHLDFIAPEGFTGAESYPTWLRSIEIGECGYGPSTDWSGFAYQQPGGSFSWSTSMMKTYEDSGIKYYEEQPIRRLRGSMIGSPITTDKEWAVARILHAMEVHLDFVIKHGDRQNSDMEWDGLDQIIRTGYVASRVYGSGTPHWADPIVVNGTTLTTAGQILTTIRVLIRRIVNRIQARNWSLNSGDLIVFMSKTMWDNLAEFVAAGGMHQYTNAYGFSGEMNIADFERRLSATKSGGLGFGTISVDGMEIPVMTDPNMGANSQFNPGGGAVDAVTGDIFILTRRAGGMTFLEQQYVDWNQLDYPAINENKFALQNGIVRAGWITEANKCYYYYGEMMGRMVCTMLPLQARINGVSVPTLDSLEVEAGAFYAKDFYAFNGSQGGEGVKLLNPQ